MSLMSGSRRWAMLVLLFLASVLNYLDRQTLSMLKPSIKADFALTDVHYSALVSMFMMPYIVMYAVSGGLVDRFGARLCMRFFVGFWSLATLLTGLVKNVWQLGVCRFALGAAEPGNWPGGVQALTLHFRASQRGFVIGLVQAGSAAGAILAPPLVALMALNYGWRSAFVVSGALGLVWLILWLLVYRAKDDLPALTKARPDWRALFRRRELWGLMAARLFSDPVWYFYLFWLPGYLQERLGLSLGQAGAIGWMPFLAADLLGVAAAAFSDHLVRRGAVPSLARRSVLIGASILAPLGMLIPHLGGLYAVLALFGLTGGICLTWTFTTTTLAGDLFRPGESATVVGLMGAAGAAGGLIFNGLVGAVVMHTSYVPVFFATGSMHVIAAIILAMTVSGALRRSQSV